MKGPILPPQPLRRISLLALCTVLAGSGTLHFLVPAPYRSIIPSPLRPWSAPLVAGSGAVEWGCGILLLLPRTRRAGALCTALLFIAVFPANVQMALDSRGGIGGVLTWLRLPLQIPLVLWAWSFRHEPR